jgi:hypothetical protein
MKSQLKHFITINNKKYFYTMKSVGKDSTFIECKDANLAQGFLNEDIPALLIDLPNLIMAEKEYDKQQSEVIRFRVSGKDKKNIEKRAIQKGYPSISSYLRDLSLGHLG